MKKYILIISIILVIVTGGYFVRKYSSPNQHMMNENSMHQQPVAQSHHTYSLHLVISNQNPQSHQVIPITFTITDENGVVLKDFALDHTKLMHFIVVRHDLQDFQHVHPDFNKDTGVFSIPVTFPESGNYRLFADFIPKGAQMGSDGMILGVTVSQDIQIAGTVGFIPVTPDTIPSKAVDGFQIGYTLPEQITTRNPIIMTLHVTKNGQTITDMQEYLGALAHGILLKSDSLDFAHLHDGGTGDHTMNMQAMNDGTGQMTNTGPDISFTYTFLSKGIYKLFTQFQEQGKIVTSDYTFQVQ